MADEQGSSLNRHWLKVVFSNSVINVKKLSVNQYMHRLQTNSVV